MRLWRVVLLLNLAVGVGVLVGWLAWGQQIPRLERRLVESQQRVLVVGRRPSPLHLTGLGGLVTRHSSTA